MSEEQRSVTTPVNPQPKALRLAATIVSYIFHPVFMPAILALALSRLEPSIFDPFKATQKLWMVTIILTTAFYPLFSILLMLKLDFISSISMPTAKERTIPLMASMIFYFWVSHVFNSVGGTVPLVLKVLFLGNLWGIIAIFMINIFTKISLHTSSAGGMVGIMLVLLMTSNINMTIPLLVSIVLAGIIGTSRMILSAHQRGDIWLGYIIGILVQLGAYIYMK